MYKQKFINPEKVLIEAGLRTGMTVADLGCGNGFFVLPAAKLVGEHGRVVGVDILEEALGQLMSQARLERRKNIRTVRGDLENPGGSGLPELAFDFITMGKILPQLKKPENLIRETYRLLKTGGLIVIVEWKKEPMSFGPPPESRLSQQEVEGMFVKQGFKYISELHPDNYHYVLVFQK